MMHTCLYVQKYDDKCEYNRIENTLPRYDAHVKSVIVIKSVEKDQVDMSVLSSQVTAM